MGKPPVQDREQLAQRMRQLGVQEHELFYYLKEELEEGIAVLPGLVIAQEVKQVRVQRGDNEWIEATVQELERLESEFNPWCSPDPELLDAYRDFRQSGMQPQSLTAIAHAVQTNLLNTLVKLLDDGSVGETEDVRWRIFEVDADGNPLRPAGPLERHVCEDEGEEPA